MRLYSWNVNGIRAVLKKDALLPFIRQHDPDVLCIQETKASPEQVAFEVPGYHIEWNSAEKKGYSGTMILSKEQPSEIRRGFGPKIDAKYKLDDKYGDTTAEGRVITAEFDKCYVCGVYTPNAKDDLSRIPMRLRWDPAFLEHIQALENSKPVIFCGDLNVAHTEEDLARPAENEGKKGFTKEERGGFEAYIDAGYTDTFRLFTEGNGHYSYWSAWGGARQRNVGWRIDYCMVSKGLMTKVRDAAIHADVMGSDHCPVSVEIDV